jgi:hypothetical protein
MRLFPRVDYRTQCVSLDFLIDEWSNKWLARCGGGRHEPTECCRGCGGAKKLRNNEARAYTGRIPAKVLVAARARVTAGFANDVDDVNQCAAVI